MRWKEGSDRVILNPLICLSNPVFPLPVWCLVDDLWGDQSLEGEPGLPPGWRKIRDAAGTYYWHVPSGSTQWQRPTWETGDAEDLGTVGGVCWRGSEPMCGSKPAAIPT